MKGEKMNKQCEHKRLEVGIKFHSGKRYTICEDCQKKWFDGGKRWKKG